MAPTLAGYLEASARRQPGRTALIDTEGATWTYAQLNEEADCIAGYLGSRGVEPGERIGVMLPKGGAAVALLFGIEKARAVAVPVEWTAPLERNREIFRDCETRLVFLDARRADLVADEHAPGREQVVWVPAGDAAAPPGEACLADALAHAPGHPPAEDRRSDDLAYILYTSGSTGVPKGVMLTQENATSFVEWCSSVFEPGENDRFSSHAPFHFDLSVLDLYLSLKHGAELHLVGEELGKDPRRLARFIAERRLTVWYSTPSILGFLAEFGHLEEQDCSSLRLVLFAGEVFPVPRLRELTRCWPTPRYFNLYGPTETNVCTFAAIPTPIPEQRKQPFPIGPACSHCTPLVLDAERGTVVAPGEEGLLYMAGPSVFPGYWNRPEHNAEVFFEHHGRRYYNTGDVVIEDPVEGFQFLGRRDRMVKRRGYRIELGEIESVLQRHPDIREAALIAAPDPEAGVRLVAHLAARGDQPPGIIALKRYCAEHLLSYMSPDRFQFHTALPRTATEKVDYQALGRP